MVIILIIIIIIIIIIVINVFSQGKLLYLYLKSKVLRPLELLPGMNGGTYVDNTKHFIFWLCNIKQLNFRHFNTNGKKCSVTVNFIQKETKTAPKRAM